MTNYIFSNSGDDLYNVYKDQTTLGNFVRTCNLVSFESAIHPEKFVKPDHYRDCYLPNFKIGVDKISFADTLSNIYHTIGYSCGKSEVVNNKVNLKALSYDYYNPYNIANYQHLKEGDSYTCCLIAREIQGEKIDYVGLVIPGKLYDCNALMD